MNLIEKLLAVDAGEITKIDTKELTSKRLRDLTGDPEAKIKIQAIDGDYFASLTADAVDKEGNAIIERSYSHNCKIVAAGLVDPDLKDNTLLTHLRAATPADAAKILFRGEINKIASEISDLSGFGNDTEEEIKN